MDVAVTLPRPRSDAASLGTRFLIFPQARFVPGYERPETVWLGKGLDLIGAAASALMEALETWAAERIPSSAIRTATTHSLGPEVVGLYSDWASEASDDAWEHTDLAWIDGFDLFAADVVPVPLALVDSRYTLPSPHPSIFPRTTTGLGAGQTLHAAIIQAGLEILERDALAEAHRMPHFFDRFQVDLSTVARGRSAPLLRQVKDAGFVVGAWRLPADHDLPVYWCHVMESEQLAEFAPLPGDGSACRISEDGALSSALLEACQARLTAISGAREDLTRAVYPPRCDRRQLAEWRSQLRAPASLTYRSGFRCAPGTAAGLDVVLDALRRAGARAAITIPLFVDETAGIDVVRMVAPPLRQSLPA